MSKLKIFLKRYLPKPIIKILMTIYVKVKYERFYKTKSKVYGLNTKHRDFELIVSFTSFPERINKAVYVADAMLRQTLKPDKVLLVLSREQFESADKLPATYVNLQKRGLTIIFDEGDLKPHKKYHYALSNYPDSIIITVDDDVYYDKNLVETLYNSYKKFPNAVSAARVHRIKLNGDGIAAYRDWDFDVNLPNQPRMDLFATGISGVLYPPHILFKDVLDRKNIRDLCLCADDVWLKTMQILTNTPTVRIDRKKLLTASIFGTQESKLCSINLGENRNDMYIKNCMDKYGITPFEFMNGIGKKER